MSSLMQSQKAYNISVVIPTYNRGLQLGKVIDALFLSQKDMFNDVEIIVIDDGSIIPAEQFINPISCPAPFHVKVIRQINSGPAAARNNGLKNATHEIVLFIDDDILVSDTLLKKHVEGHLKFPNSVIFGCSPYVIPEKKTASYRYLARLIESDMGDEFVPVEVVASGNISVSKTLFSTENLYNSNLRTPAAEEFQLAANLKKRSIPAYFNKSIYGWHMQSTAIEDKCIQEFKYGIGIAEVYYKGIYPENVEQLIGNNTFNDSNFFSVKSYVKKILATKVVAKILSHFISLLEKYLPIDTLLFPLYNIICGIYLYRGINEGVSKFGQTSK